MPIDKIYTDKLAQFISTLGLSEEMSQRFIGIGEIVTMKRKEFLVRQGEPCRYVIAVIEGEFRFSYEKPDGKEITAIGFITNGFATEYHALLKQVPAGYSIQAMTDSVVYRLTRQQILDFYEYNMEGQRFGRQIAEELFFRRDELLLSFRCDSPKERYLKILKVCKHLHAELSLKDLASLIGVTPETISRIRKKLLEESRS